MEDSTKRQMRILRERRKELGFRQQDVASEAGISLQQYQNFEHGRRKIANCSTLMGLRICAALELDPYELVFENGRDYVKRVKEGMK
jgi:transcriptional regulator with XRE-family HTH domain